MLRCARLCLPLVAAILLIAPSALAVTMDWVTVGDPGNACDTQPPRGEILGAASAQSS